jgi:ABC-type xylose transport system substrate-binding protein
MKKPGLFLLVTILYLFSFFLCSCGGKSTAPTVVSPNKSSGPNVTQTAQATQAIQMDEKAILKETQAFIVQLSKDLAESKTEAVLKQLESSSRQQIGELDLTSPGAKKLAEAISKAKSTQVNPTIVFYESTIDGEAISFYIIKEAGQWKLGGL